MKFRELNISGCYEVHPEVHRDDRGEFLEWYRFDKLAGELGHTFSLQQANLSVSKKGTVRGVHYAQIPPSQAKYVTVPKGEILDFVIDLRTGSPTFGKWEAIELNESNRNAVYISEGVGHCFIALSEGATVCYLASAVYSPEREFAVNPLDSDLNLKFPLEKSDLLLSPKDLEAPSLKEALADGNLPSWQVANSYRAALLKGSLR